jgi:quercetin dioxygenase-like cupin family protein
MLANQTAYFFDKEGGPAIWTMGFLARLKATGEQTGGAFSLVDELCPPGYATPFHIHHAEDETFYILEGTVTIFCGDQKIKAEPGAYVYAPRDIPHGFRIEGDTPARLLILATPAGFDQFIAESGEPARALTLPPAGPVDVAKMNAVAAKYRIELLGPLPE